MPSGARFTMVMITIMFGGVGLLFIIGGFMMMSEAGYSADAALFAGAGGICAIIGFTPLMMTLRKRLIKNNVLRHGTIVQSEFVDVVLAEYAVNNWRPYLIRTQWLDQQTNKLYFFKSGPITNNPARFLKKELNIPVYINPSNPKQYYMDLEATPGLKGIHLK